MMYSNLQRQQRREFLFINFFYFCAVTLFSSWAGCKALPAGTFIHKHFASSAKKYEENRKRKRRKMGGGSEIGDIKKREKGEDKEGGEARKGVRAVKADLYNMRGKKREKGHFLAHTPPPLMCRPS